MILKRGALPLLNTLTLNNPSKEKKEKRAPTLALFKGVRSSI
jgi:hypothetical protein